MDQNRQADPRAVEVGPLVVDPFELGATWRDAPIDGLEPAAVRLLWLLALRAHSREWVSPSSAALAAGIPAADVTTVVRHVRRALAPLPELAVEDGWRLVVAAGDEPIAPPSARALRVVFVVPHARRGCADRDQREPFAADLGEPEDVEHGPLELAPDVALGLLMGVGRPLGLLLAGLDAIAQFDGYARLQLPGDVATITIEPGAMGRRQVTVSMAAAPRVFELALRRDDDDPSRVWAHALSRRAPGRRSGAALVSALRREPGAALRTDVIGLGADIGVVKALANALAGAAPPCGRPLTGNLALAEIPPQWIAYATVGDVKLVLGVEHAREPSPAFVAATRARWACERPAVRRILRSLDRGE